MDESQIQRLIDELDTAPRVTKPWIQTQSGKLPYVMITSNREGLIYLARELLAAAISPVLPETGAKPVHIEREIQVVGKKTDLLLTAIECSTSLADAETTRTERHRRAWNSDKFFIVGCAIVGIGSLFLLVSGIVLWGAILTGNWK